MTVKNAIEAVERTGQKYLKENTSKDKKILFGKVIEGRIKFNYYTNDNKKRFKENGYIK